MTLKRTMCALLAATMIAPTAVMAEIAASAAEVDVEESSVSVSEESSTAGYGLANSIQEGTILHCFDWKYSDIKAELPNIAAAGFTSVQTSPAQPDGTGSWYWLYQPKGFYIGTNGLGTKQDLTDLCAEAEKYGIKVVVDVVANHLNGTTSSVQSDLQSDQYWHTYGDVSNWNDRYQVIYGEIGMRDLATENPYVQQKVKDYILELKGVGVDGIRWDAAKHIGLPSEQGDFWKVVTDTGLWNYGEILDSPGGDSVGVMKEYTQYISVTDSVYAISVRDGNDQKQGGFRNGMITDSFGNWAAKGIAENKLVYWAESHDTWANAYDWGYSWDIGQNAIDRTYAVVASRYGASALYLSRPFSSPNAKENTHVGEKGSTHFTDKEVAEINKFHNAMVGKKDYYTSSNGCAVVTRQGGGAVIVKGSGSGQVSVTNGGGYAPSGTYKDAISGNTFTVTDSTISGTIGDTGIAVIYDATPIVVGGVSATPATGTKFDDTLTVTLNASEVTNQTYKTSEGASGSYKDGQTIVVGASTAEGSTVTVTVTGTKSDGSTDTKTYTYTKTAPVEYPTLNGSGFVFNNSDKNWSTVNAYVYSGDGASATSNAAWPGAKMTNAGNGFWTYELDSKFSSGSVRVIFNNGSEQIPASQEPGYLMNVGDKKIYENGAWGDLKETSKIKVSLTASPTTVNVGDSVTLTATATGATGAVTYTFSDGSTQIQSSSKNTATWTPSTEGKHTITVTAKDSKGSATGSATVTVNENNTDPVVKVDKASGTSFTSEVTTLKLTLANATKGTYSVDDGPVKEFTGSKTITIGEGKISDSTVTVKTTATNGSTTKTYTYTYEKKYQKKTSSASGTTASKATVAVETSGAALAKQYQTNPNGFGKQKTITIDGDISDWTSDMLIAQGAANDDPRVYRPNSMYELPVDLYALYGAYDDSNVYLMWEMTNVQDVVAPNDDYPVSQGILWQTQELPFFIAVDTGKSDAIGNKGQLQTGGTIWNSGMTISNRFNRLISINTKGGNGPYVYSGDSKGLNPVEILDATTSKIKMGYGKGILSKSVIGIDGAYGESNGRVVGDVCNDSAAWVDFNTKGHNTSGIDFFYELSIPYSELGITKSDVASNGIGVMLVATFGMSGMDCLPYDVSMNDNADQPDTQSQENNSFEKSDSDNITASFARIGANSTDTDYPDSDSDTDSENDIPLQVNFGTNKSAPQYASTALTLKGIGYGGTAPYKYQFSVDDKVVKASNTTDTYTWTPTTAGNHSIKCVITDATGKTSTSIKSFTAEESGDTPIVDTLVNNSTISATTVNAGTKVALRGAATGGTGTYSYGYYYKSTTATAWTKIGTGAYVTFTPAAGTYNVKVNVVDGAGTVAAKNYTLTVKNILPLTNTSTISATTVNAGTKVALRGAATGGSGTYSYGYYYKKTTATAWTKIGTGAYVTFTPAAGTYNVKVNVVDGAGTVAVKNYTLTVKTVQPLVNTTTISATSVNAGTKVALRGAATGGTGTYSYGYYYKKTTATAWTKIGTGAYVIFTPAAGTYNVKVNVLDGAGTVAVKNYTLTVKTVQPLVNTTTISATTVNAGTKVALRGAATGGSGTYSYGYYYKKTTATAWTKIGTGAYVIFTPAAGTYNVKVNVLDGAGTVAVKNYTLTVKTVQPLANTTTISATSVTSGTKVALRGAATGGSGTYSYGYYYKKTTATAWTKIGTGAYVIFTPAVGTYNVKVNVLDGAGTVATKTYTLTVTSAALTNTSTISATSVSSGATVTLKGAATGGTTPYKYAYLYKKSTSSSWTVIGTEYGTSTSATFKPTGSGSTYQAAVKIMDNTSETVTKTFTVTVK